MSELVEVIGKSFALKNNTKRINGVPVEIKGYIDVDTMKNVVQVVSQTCFEDGEYKSENREISRRYAILKYLTDIEVDGSPVEEVFKMTQGGTWYGDIEREVIKLPLWAEIEQAIDRQIDYIISTRQTSFDKLCSDLSAIIQTENSQNLADVKEVLNKLEKVNKQDFVEAITEDAIKKADASVKKTAKKK